MSRRLRICRIQSRICVGGPAQQTILLSSRLDPSRYETILIGGGLEPDEVDMMPAARQAGIQTITVPQMRRSVRPGSDLSSLQRVTSILRELKPDIVHTHTAKAGAIGRLAARRARVPVVVHTFHGHVLDGYFSRGCNACFRWTERMLARLSDRIIVISESQRRELAGVHRIAPERKIDVIPLGLDLDRFAGGGRWRGMLRGELGLTEAVPMIGWAGRLTAVKDPLLFLRAGALLGKIGGAACHFVVTGDGDLRARAQSEAARLGITSRTHFLGTRRDIERIYADCDLFVLTSHNEGTPAAMIEAMASGLPVVAADVGGVADVAADYPLTELVGDRVPAEFARRIEIVLAGGRRRGDGQVVLRRYHVDRLLCDIDRLYTRLAREKGLACATEPRQAA